MSAYVSVDVSSESIGAECARSADMLAEIFNDLQYRQSVGDFAAAGRWLAAFVGALDPGADEIVLALARAVDPKDQTKVE